MRSAIRPATFNSLPACPSQLQAASSVISNLIFSICHKLTYFCESQWGLTLICRPMLEVVLIKRRLQQVFMPWLTPYTWSKGPWRVWQQYLTADIIQRSAQLLLNEARHCYASHCICTLQCHSWVIPNRQHSQITACALLLVVTSIPSDPGSATIILLGIFYDPILWIHGQSQDNWLDADPGACQSDTLRWKERYCKRLSDLRGVHSVNVYRCTCISCFEHTWCVSEHVASKFRTLNVDM